MERLFVYLTQTDFSAGVIYGLIFGLLVACGLGFPLPEDIPLVAMGYLIGDGTVTWSSSLLVTLSGVLIGDTILFCLGNQLGLRILNSNKITVLFSKKKVRRTRAYFRIYGEKIVFFARFVAGFRAAAFFMAGAMKMKYRRFIWLDGVAALISVPLWIVGGYFLQYYLGDEIAQILKSIKSAKIFISGAVILIILVVFVNSYRKYRRMKKPTPKATA